MKTFCFKCSHELQLAIGSDISRTEECPKCSSSLRCCKMCGHFDKNVYNECTEPMADRVVEKEKANFCDYFKLGSQTAKIDEKASALAKANALFKK